jgi:predicted acyl esterase
VARSRLLCRDGHRHTTRELTRGYLSAVHRDLTDPELVPLLEPVTYRIRSYPFDKTVAAGSAIRVVLAGYDGRTTPILTAYTAEVARSTGTATRVAAGPYSGITSVNTSRLAGRSPITVSVWNRSCSSITSR